MRIARIQTEKKENQDPEVDLALIDQLISKYKGKKAGLSPLLQGAQDI